MADTPKLDPDCFLYIEHFFNQEKSDELYNFLKDNIEWEEKEITLFGNTYLQPRLIAWFGDKDYKYSRSILKKKKMPRVVKEIKEKIEEKLNCKFNSVLLNYYRDGNDSMGLHSDDERELGPKPNIASLSLGEIRDFTVKSKIDGYTQKIQLQPGSLLLMKGDAQKIYSHGINKTKKNVGGRINLTFRYVY